MFGFGKKDKEKKQNGEQKNKNTVGTFQGLVDVTKEVFKKRDYKIEKRELTSEDKKAILYTAIVIIGIIVLLFALPFTRQFMIDFFTLKY